MQNLRKSLLCLLLGLAIAGAYSDTWYHSDGFTLQSSPRVMLQGLPGSEDHFLALPALANRQPVDGMVYRLSIAADNDDELILLAIQLFRTKVPRAGNENIERINFSLDPVLGARKAWRLNIRTENTEYWLHILELPTTPGGLASHVILYANRPGNEGRADIDYILPGFEVEIENAAG